MFYEKSMRWGDFNPRYSQEDPNFHIILDYYLWSCPSPHTAFQAKTLNELGWHGGPMFRRLKGILLKITDQEIQYYKAQKENIEDILDSYNQIDYYDFNEVIILVPKEGEVSSVFRYIRHSLAHGSFTIQKSDSSSDFFYFFENRDPKDNYTLIARIVLKSSTLLSWIDIIKNGPTLAEI